MADCMEFPKDWAKFLEDYSFKDHKEFYTNGARLIPTFRVEQMMHHYLRKATEDAVEVVHGRWEEDDPPKHYIFTGVDVLYRCSECNNRFVHDTKYCPNCGAKMDGGNEDV